MTIKARKTDTDENVFICIKKVQKILKRGYV